MIGRRPLWGLFLFATVLHVMGMVRNPLPSQDGLKFIRIAREFAVQPWLDVVRNADQHPIYPALIACAYPIVGRVAGAGPEGWRIAAQGVSLLATLLLIVPFRAFARRLVDDASADLAVLILLSLPAIAELGHETLSDAAALCAFAASLALGLRAFGAGRPAIRFAVAAGIVAGIGYLVRPEVAAVPAFLTVAVLARRSIPGRSTIARIAAMLLPASGFVIGYAGVNGTISDKLLVKFEAERPAASPHQEAASPLQDAAGPFPSRPGDRHLDLPPKEESDAPGRLGPSEAAATTLGAIAEATSWAMVPLALIGLASGRARHRGGLAARVVWLHAIGFSGVLGLHAMRMGYLSSRHCVTICLVLAPWASAGAVTVLDRIVDRFHLEDRRRARIARAAVAGLVVLGLGIQSRAGHPSRWGHQAAGHWLADHAEVGEAVLDTRGWAAFVSGLRAYDPWHFRQALTDARLSYIVVGEDELRASSRRAAILDDVLHAWAAPIAAFPSRRDGEGIGVRIYRFRRPSEWEESAR